jgi:1,4-alpha-glucan branching enzyme
MSDDAWLASDTDRAAVEALLRAEHGDPVALRGPHRTRTGRRVVRGLLPHARAVDMIDQQGRVRAALPMLAEGFFAGPVDPTDTDPAYRLAIDDGSGTRTVVDDPYRFGPLLGELDLDGVLI